MINKIHLPLLYVEHHKSPEKKRKISKNIKTKENTVCLIEKIYQAEVVSI